MAIQSPENKVWWNEPVARGEIVWIAIAFLWGVLMFGMMIYWHLEGEQNLSNEAYRIDPDVFAARAEAMAADYTVREEAGYPVVHPPPGSDVYMIARLCGNAGPSSNSRRARATGCICRPWTGSTGSRCSRPTSTSRSTPATNWS